MNITHAVHEEVTGDRLQAIFTRQKELMEKYHHIEASSGLLQTDDCPVNLDDKRGQARIKDFAWRITEEVGEALDAMFGEKDRVHYIEELIDGLHFLTEMTILTGKDWDTLLMEEELFTPKETTTDTLELLHFNSIIPSSEGVVSIELSIMTLIQYLGMMCNCLKNKPWKQTQMQTDKAEFYSYLEKVWRVYVGILAITDLAPDDIVDIYLKKSQVNKFRQRSNY